METHQNVLFIVVNCLFVCLGESDRPCTMEDINNMTYLNCVIKVSDSGSDREVSTCYFLEVNDFTYICKCKISLPKTNIKCLIF